MVKDTGALRPSFYRPEPVMAKVEDIETITEEEKVLAAGSVNEFWQILKKHINNAIEQLESANDQAIAKGIPMEEIGRNTIVLSLVKASLKGLIHKVEDAQEAMDKEALDERGAKK